MWWRVGGSAGRALRRACLPAAAGNPSRIGVGGGLRGGGHPHYRGVAEDAINKMKDGLYKPEEKGEYGHMGLEDVPYHQRKVLKIPNFLNGIDVLHNSLWNKGCAFMHGERDRLNIRGLVPARVESKTDQLMRTKMMVDSLRTDIMKNLYLRDLQETNETLFHAFLQKYIAEIAPIVYTPTVGVVCQRFGSDFRRPRGMYFSRHDVGQIGSLLYNWPSDDIHVIVVTDGGRVLGLGDLGVNGMGICIGKLALYCAVGGIAPHRVLPVVLDVGTDNEELLKDPFYNGTKFRRMRGDDYYRLVDEFVIAASRRWPKAVIQFEDFSSDKANTVLQKYRHKLRCFNDDIQGTGAVAVAGLMGAMRAQGKEFTELCDQKFVVAGNGSAGIGICTGIVQALVAQGMTPEDARSLFHVVGIDGVLSHTKYPDLPDEAAVFAREDTGGMTLEDVIETVKPTVLIGATAVPGLFSKRIVETMMAGGVERPIIFPLSNPTSKAEITALDAYTWTEGKAILASGSPFDPVDVDGVTFRTSQCNNVYIFPGLGQGAVLSQCKEVSDEMVLAASIALAASVTDEERERGQVFPSIERIVDVQRQVGYSVFVTAVTQGLASPAVEDKYLPLINAQDKEKIWELLGAKLYCPVYVPLVGRVY